ncbi:MAG: ligase-associated DNA damage response endonuclease PdeM [Pseudomonadota bacterium]|nr:ligase-associated DNA damage response endonuclease PdeM [Pseudomonadota bacterium]
MTVSSSCSFTRAGIPMLAYPDGSLFIPHERLLVFSDLHLEKGRAMAGHAPLPEMDTDTTLADMQTSITRDNPDRVLFLGDSFHRSQMAASLPMRHRNALQAMLSDREVIWITGNHDPDLPDYLTGSVRQELTLGALIFRHEAGRLPRQGSVKSIEISGHFHPKIRLATRARRITGRCFMVMERRLIMPAFGAYAGGLYVNAPALKAFHDDQMEIFFCHACRIYRYAYSQLKHNI